MMTPNLSTPQLEKILALLKERDGIDQQIAILFGGSSAGAAAAPAASTPARRRGRPPKSSVSAPVKATSAKKSGGTLKDQIVALLQNEGPGGLSVGEVAERIGAKKSSVNFWFYTAGKKVKGLKKVARGTFAYKG